MDDTITYIVNIGILFLVKVKVNVLADRPLCDVVKCHYCFDSVWKSLPYEKRIPKDWVNLKL